MWVGFIKSNEDVNRTDRLTLLQVREKFILTDCFELGHGFFPAIGLELKYQLFLSLGPASP